MTQAEIFKRILECTQKEHYGEMLDLLLELTAIQAKNNAEWRNALHTAHAATEKCVLEALKR